MKIVLGIISILAVCPSRKVGEAAGIGNAPTGGLAVQKGSVRTLVNTLANILGAPVADKTGLTGTYDFTLQWTNSGALNGPDSEFPSLVTAVQEQLGLRLESQKRARGSPRRRSCGESLGKLAGKLRVVTRLLVAP
jgi:hypothetical protein